MIDTQEVYVSVVKVTGGYIVDTNKGREIVVSLPKVMKIVKEVLKPELLELVKFGD